MSNNHSQKFYCYSCNKETLGIISDVQTSRGINQCIICTNCFNMVSLSLLDKIKIIRFHFLVQDGGLEGRMLISS